MSGSLQTISFDEIPASYRVPGTYIEAKANYANIGILDYPARALVIGQKLATGTATVATAYRITRDDQLDALFGAGSVAAQMGRRFRAANTTSELWVMALADPATATAAAGAWVVTGNSTAAGTIAVAVGTRRITVSVPAGTSAVAAGTALRAAVAAVTDLPVTAAGVDGNVAVTAKHKGVVGNAIPLLVNPASDDHLPPGLSIAVTAMADGAGVPDIGDALAAIEAEWFTDIASAWGDSPNLSTLNASLGERYTAMGKRDAHAYVGLAGTFGTLSAAGAALNGKFMSVIGADGSPSTPWEWAASLCAIGVFHLTNDPARQLRTIALPGIAAPPPEKRFAQNERELLLRDGISTWTVDPDGTVRLERVVTTYQVSPLGIEDTAWLDIMVPKTLSRIRYDWASYISLNFPRHKLADDGSPAAEYSDAVVTPRILHGSWGARCQLYTQRAWIEDVTRTVGLSRFVRDGTDKNRANAKQIVDIIGNLMVFAASLEFEA
ncbi:phage tail sheath subtilisin-like domain-containing protein [Plastoroseomonas hellenica]|uniref:phage tail sheath subtilisin-like domain-containing protein n=1 Tax=Plastoroseomonas hellenica TaxID=2687306 RepID=UPI001BADFE66|nr:phage tail sheath subtilisin-like domain-containing protein [Plastoroseomonas hellenica]MBR0643988.1 phage tail protein [Plastoroseomonas hellenica]